MERIDEDDAVFTCCHRDNSAYLLTIILYPPVKAHSGLRQRYRMNVFG